MVNIPDEAVQADFERRVLECVVAKPVELLDDESLQKKISEIGNQIHNLSCEYQNDDNLQSRLSGLSIKLWEIAKGVNQIKS